LTVRKERIGGVVRNRATEFVDRWELEHVTHVAIPEREKTAQRLALRCREDAARAGISEQELEEAVEGDLVANMVAALDAAAFRQLARDQWADAGGDAGV
jgi:hypothetical protein